MGVIRNGQYSKRRTIDGIRVLVKCMPDATGFIQENFAVRIKHPAGDINLDFRACYYWQVFNGIRQMWPTLMERMNKV